MRLSSCWRHVLWQQQQQQHYRGAAAAVVARVGAACISARRSHATTITASAGECVTPLCELCDSAYTSWHEHARLPSHMARVAVCNVFAAPERADAVMQQLQRHIHLDVGVIDELTAQKDERRRSRLRSTLVHLADEGVLRYALPYVPAKEQEDNNNNNSSNDNKEVHDDDGSGGGVAQAQDERASMWCVLSRDEFVKCAVLGEGAARVTMLDRVARLLPSVGAAELSAIVHCLLSPRALAAMFDALDMRSVCVRDGGGSSSSSGTPPVRLRRDDKATVLLALLGELTLYKQRDRSYNVVDKAAADALVLNVLTAHALDHILAELVHVELQRYVDEGLPVWRSYQTHLQHRELEQPLPIVACVPPCTPQPVTAPQAKAATAAATAVCGDDASSSSSDKDATRVMQQQLRGLMPLWCADGTVAHAPSLAPPHVRTRAVTSTMTAAAGAHPPVPRVQVLWVDVRRELVSTRVHVAGCGAGGEEGTTDASAPRLAITPKPATSRYAQR